MLELDGLRRGKEWQVDSRQNKLLACGQQIGIATSAKPESKTISRGYIDSLKMFKGQNTRFYSSGGEVDTMPNVGGVI